MQLSIKTYRSRTASDDLDGGATQGWSSQKGEEPQGDHDVKCTTETCWMPLCDLKPDLYTGSYQIKHVIYTENKPYGMALSWTYFLM